MTAEPQSRLLTAEPQSRLLRFAQGPKVKILVSFGIGQVLIFATSVARIPLIIHSLGASGYGLLLAVTALAPWMLLVIGGLNNVGRVDIAEALGAAGEQSAWATLEHHRRRSYRVSAWVGAISILAALVVPWNSLLVSQPRPAPGAVRGSARHRGLGSDGRPLGPWIRVPGIAARRSPSGDHLDPARGSSDPLSCGHRRRSCLLGALRGICAGDGSGVLRTVLVCSHTGAVAPRQDAAAAAGYVGNRAFQGR